MRAWLLLGLCACTTVPTVTANPVPPAETLRAADCAAAASVYQALLVKPVASPLAQSRAGLPSAQTFTTTCTDKLAGHTHRAVLRCYRDAESAAAFLACSERF